MLPLPTNGKTQRETKDYLADPGWWWDGPVRGADGHTAGSPGHTAAIVATCSWAVLYISHYSVVVGKTCDFRYKGNSNMELSRTRNFLATLWCPKYCSHIYPAGSVSWDYCHSSMLSAWLFFAFNKQSPRPPVTGINPSFLVSRIPVVMYK